MWLENYYRNRCTLKVIAQLEYVRTFDTVNYTSRGGGGPGMSGTALSENRVNRWFTRYLYLVDGKEYSFQKSYYSDKVMYSYVKVPQIFSREMAELTEPVEQLTIMVDPRNPKSYYELPGIYQKNNQQEHDDDLKVPELYDY